LQWYFSKRRTCCMRFLMSCCGYLSSLWQVLYFCVKYVFCIFGQVWSKRRKSEGCVKNTVCTYWRGEHSKLVLSWTTPPIWHSCSHF
jgi:hypothetical protein